MTPKQAEVIAQKLVQTIDHDNGCGRWFNPKESHYSQQDRKDLEKALLKHDYGIFSEDTITNLCTGFTEEIEALAKKHGLEDVNKILGRNF